MKRPHLVHFLALTTDQFINIKASITMKENQMAYVGQSAGSKIAEELGKELPIKAASFPIQAFRLLNAYEFKLKIVGINDKQEEIFKKVFESDSFGNFNFKIPLDDERKTIVALKLYEVGKRSGMELVLGTYMPLKISAPKKIAICDFDKTLVDTKYSTTKELYTSLTSPISYFPTVQNSVDILSGYLDKGFHPFILSASPHFYEHAMRDWLYQNKIYSAGIFLKDYRQIFSIFEANLTPKDLKAQGLYKVNHILDILLMTGIPNELVLMGDNYESDPLIYLTMASLLTKKVEPWHLWNLVKTKNAFLMNRKQDSQLLNKIYQLAGLLDRHLKDGNSPIDIKIYIRKRGSETSTEIPSEFKDVGHLIQLYDGHAKQLGHEIARGEKQDVPNTENKSHSVKTT